MQTAIDVTKESDSPSDAEKAFRIEMGKRLRNIRLAKNNMSQAEVAALFKLAQGQATISAYENGRQKLGRHGMQMYVALMGASSEYIKTGNGPMFASPKRGEYTRDAVIDALSPKPTGNLRFVSARDIGRFLDMGFAFQMPYQLVPGDCYSFPITDYELGSDFPVGAQLICTRYPATGLTVGRIYVFQMEDKLVTRIYSGLTEDNKAYRLTCAHGPEMSLKLSDVVQVYHVERIDKPVL